MKVQIALLVLGAVLVLSDAKRVRKSKPAATGGNDQPAPNTICENVPRCNPPCILDISGPCPRCDCSNTCSVSCSGTNCKVIRNGRQCSCVCSGGNNGGGGNNNVCAVACSPGCRKVTDNGQCACYCN
ncbi:spider silk-constituting element SpiCE-NMa2A1 [Nephila pilipes]|uniref:Spider silk-constituting element SpiCE-NMa2A1 n=1 Tax=Nephila pilipes TaxID=299642 RepID=A0A8X6UPN3_NEPPI|nr:spider silk-constituting element SpiCE-NMa2A1 [Nephila pilipes]